MDLEAILFDVDDTLFDRIGAQRATLDLLTAEFADLFAGLDQETLLEAFLESDRLTVHAFNAQESCESTRTRRSRLFLEMLGLGSETVGPMTSFYVREYPHVGRPVPGARVVLEALAGRFRLGVVSDGLPDVQYRKLETLGVRHLFEVIVLSGELNIWKPDARIFAQAVGALGCSPAACLYVGDSYERDVVGARNAGLRACWFNPGRLEPPGEVRPDFEIYALGELLENLTNDRRS